MARWLILFISTVLLTASMGMGGLEAKDGDAQLGVYLQDLNDELREELGFSEEGVLVIGLVEGASAESAGIKKGDIIVAFNGRSITSTSDLVEAIGETAPGDKIKVIVVSSGEPSKLKVRMGSKIMANKEFVIEPPAKKWMQVYEKNRPWLGVSLQELTPQLVDQLKVEHGVLIVGVAEEGPAEKAGVEAGDVIIAINEEGVENSEDLIGVLLKKKEGDEVKLRTIREGEKKNIAVILENREGEGPGVFEYFLGEEPYKAKSYKYRYLIPPELNKVPRFRQFYTIPEMPKFPDVPRPVPPGTAVDIEKLQEALERYEEEVQELRDEVKSLRKELIKLKKNMNM